MLMERQGRNKVTMVHNGSCDELSFMKSVIRQPDPKCYSTMAKHTCALMRGAAVYDVDSSHSLTFHIKFPDEIYTEILSLREFGPESLGAGIGGYIGIFVGYSIMQIPTLFIENVKNAYLKIDEISKAMKTSKVQQGTF